MALDEGTITAPRGIILNIDPASAVTLLPVVTISAVKNSDTVIVTATIVLGPIGAEDVPLKIELLDSASNSIDEKTLVLARGTSTPQTTPFNSVPSGAGAVRASAPPNTLRITNPRATIIIPPKVELTLTSDRTFPEQATAIARITDGTIDIPVTITAHLTGPVSVPPQDLPRLSSSSGPQAVTFSRLPFSIWALDESATIAPAGVILNVVTTPVHVTKAPSPAVVTPTLTDDNLMVEVAVTDGSSLAWTVPVRLRLTGGRRTTDVRMRTVNLDANRPNPRGSAMFGDLPSGRYTLTASGGEQVGIASIIPSILTVPPKVALTLVPNAAGEAIATVRITDGTIDTPVAIRAFIDGPGVASAHQKLPALSGSTGQERTFTFSGLQPGTWALDESAITAPDGIILSVASASADVAAVGSMPPAEVGGLSLAIGGERSVILNWDDPSDAGLASIRIEPASGGAPLTVAAGQETYRFDCLTSGDTSVRVRTVAKDGAVSVGTKISITRAGEEGGGRTGARAVPLATTVCGSVANEADRDWYKVELTDERLYRIVMDKSPGSNVDPIVRLFPTPNTDTFLADNNGANPGQLLSDARLYYQATRTGFHDIEVTTGSAHSSTDINWTGDYRLQVSEVVGSIPANSAPTPNLNSGQRLTRDIEDYELVWSDEFDATTRDRTRCQVVDCDLYDRVLSPPENEPLGRYHSTRRISKAVDPVRSTISTWRTLIW